MQIIYNPPILLPDVSGEYITLAFSKMAAGGASGAAGDRSFPFPQCRRRRFRDQLPTEGPNERGLMPHENESGQGRRSSDMKCLSNVTIFYI